MSQQRVSAYSAAFGERGVSTAAGFSLTFSEGPYSADERGSQNQLEGDSGGGVAANLAIGARMGVDAVLPS